MMKNKKAIAVLLLVAMLFSIMPTAVFAEESAETTTAYVTIVDKGEIVVAHEVVTVTTGSAIIDDFLYKVHKSHGKTYATTIGAYGLSITTLWDDSSYNFGYWVNDASARGLTDSVENGDHIVAFITQNAYPYNESYSCFDLDRYIVQDSIYGAYLELELNQAGYDSSWNTIFTALGNENVVVLNDDLTAANLNFTTDSEGKVGISFPVLNENENEKHYFVTVQQGEDKTIVPPICEVTVKKVLTAVDNEKNAQSKAMKKITDVITNLNANTPIVAKKGDNILTAINNIINDEAFTVVLDENTDIYDSNGIITETNSKGAVNVQATIEYGNVTKSIVIPVIINGLLADSEKLLHNIASGYINATNKWNVMDLANYSRLYNNKYKLSDSAKQNYINTIINGIQQGSYGETDYSTVVILPLTALGVDSTRLYPINSNTPINAISKLVATTPYISEWVTPYTLMAYNQGIGAGENETSLLNAMLSRQNDGSWGDSVDSTGEMLTVLAFYQGDDTVDTAIENAVNYLSGWIREDGVFTDGYNGYNANSTAMAVIGLAAVYDKNNETITELFDKSVKGLLSFAVNDNSGFWKAPDTSIANAKATEQGFRALIAASQVMETGEAFNVYDFSGNTLVPGYEKEITSSGGSGSYVPKDDKITVKVSIKAIDGYWMQNKSVKVDEGASVSDAFLKAIKGTSITQEGAEDGYISYMEYNGEELGEFTHGDNSGWMYKVNGVSPVVGVTDYELSDGDKILFYFTEDYTKEFMDDADEKDEDKKDEEAKPTTTPVTELVDDVDGHWAIDAIQFVYDRGLLTGISENEFAPDLAVTRAMMATIMYGMAGNPEHGWHYPFHDVFDMAWYAGPVAWAYENKLVYGVSDTSYAPETSITREQVAMMLMRYANFKGYDISQTVSLNHYKDAKNVSDYAESAMQWAVAIGMIGGRTADTLCAQDTATRAELSVMLRNFITLSETIDSYNSTTK